MKETECDCDDCVAMCTRMPCRPTPEEARALIDAGLGDRLVRADYEVPHLQPKGTRRDEYLEIERGRCTFLTEDGKCELHGWAKPLEGRLSHCKDQTGDPLTHVLAMWKTPLGRELVKR